MIALSTAIAAVVALLGIAQGFQDSFADVYRSHSVDVVVSRQGAADRLSSSIDEVLVGQIDDVDGVEKSAAVLLETLSLEEEGVYGIPAMGMAEGSWLLDDFELRGSAPAADEVLLGIHLADRLELGPGDSVSLFDDPYVVSGVFTSRSTWENGSMVLPLSLLQVLTGREGQVTYSNVVLSEFESAVRGATADADLKVDTVIDADAVIEKIRNLDSKLLPLVTEEFVETDTRMQIASAMAWMTSMIAIVIGAIGTLNTMMTSVMERTDEIGILRAIGWSRRRIVGMIFGEACLLAMFAGALGG
ncbi:MAG: ABC transporter permease, partial [Planctomycetota bacterium]